MPANPFRETPSQTAGPYVHIGCIPSFAGLQGMYPEDLGLSPIKAGARGTAITISGSVLDGAGLPLLDAMIESWQPDAKGRFAGQDGCDPSVTGFARFATDASTGEFSLSTIKPGPVALRDGRICAPHIAIFLVARGINMGLQTRIYFGDEDNSRDPLLSGIEHRERADTLISNQTGPGTYHFDIHLQGPLETVFLDI